MPAILSRAFCIERISLLFLSLAIICIRRLHMMDVDSIPCLSPLSFSFCQKNTKWKRRNRTTITHQSFIQSKRCEIRQSRKSIRISGSIMDNRIYRAPIEIHQNRWRIFELCIREYRAKEEDLRATTTATSAFLRRVRCHER